jgi:hypothetical protein
MKCIHCFTGLIVFLVLLSNCSGRIPTEPPYNMVVSENEKGILTGQVTFIGLPCNPDIPNFKVPPCEGPYPNYPITVYTVDGRTTVARTSSDKNGNYRIELSAGNYIIYTQSGLNKSDVRANQVTIANGRSTRLDLAVDTGIR